jgi:hypothetical protein
VHAKDAGDNRLLGVYGYSVELPGVRGDIEKLTRVHGVRMIEGPGDALKSKMCEALNNNIILYAKLYNERILRN